MSRKSIFAVLKSRTTCVWQLSDLSARDLRNLAESAGCPTAYPPRLIVYSRSNISRQISFVARRGTIVSFSRNNICVKQCNRLDTRRENVTLHLTASSSRLHLACAGTLLYYDKIAKGLKIVRSKLPSQFTPSPHNTIQHLPWANWSPRRPCLNWFYWLPKGKLAAVLL